MIKKLLILLSITLNITLTAQSSATKSDVVNNVKRSSIMNSIRHLENFGTRFCLAPNRFEIANWIKGEFESMGFEQVELDSFVMVTKQWRNPITGIRLDTTTTQVNVVATLPGTETPEEIYVIGGHYDCYCDNANLFVRAPGADDDASGTSCVLESAKAIMHTGYRPRSTLVFIAFASEELGMTSTMGSVHYALEAGERGDDIKLVINNDMIGFNAHHITQASVNVAPTSSFTRINDVVDICKTYGQINFLGEGYSGADLMGFTQVGYDGIYFEESDFNYQINYHKSTDVSTNIDSLYITEVIKGATAVLISMEDILSSNDEREKLPNNFILEQNYPNPFNPGTFIEYGIPKTEQVSIRVYSLLGELVTTLVDEIKSPGKYKTYFSAENLSGGIYFYTIIVGDYRESKKMIILK